MVIEKVLYLINHFILFGAFYLFIYKLIHLVIYLFGFLSPYYCFVQ